jgi:succinate-semialdehyde dehydrogenase/glutarate-semialdehyde dehydrogenase
VTEILARETGLLEASPTALLLGGRWRAGAGGVTIPVLDPATELPLTQVALAEAVDVADAIEHAAAASRTWRRAAPARRGAVLIEAAELVVGRAEDLALLLSLEAGKPLDEARSEVRVAAAWLHWAGNAAVQQAGLTGSSADGAARVLVAPRAIGPTVVVAPPASPLAAAAAHAGSALAAGSPVVLIAPGAAPLSVLALAAALSEAGAEGGLLGALVAGELPPLLEAGLARGGVAQVVAPDGAVALAGLASMRVPPGGIVSSGGPPVPFLVFADADLDLAVEAAVASRIRSPAVAGAVPTRFLVSGRVAEDFVERLAARAAGMVRGRGTMPGVELGPLGSAAAVEALAESVEDARWLGATVVTGGAPDPGPGYFFPPTVLASVHPSSRVVTERIDGPLVAVETFSSDAEALARADPGGTGLGELPPTELAFVHTGDLGRALRVAELLEAATVSCNEASPASLAGPGLGSLWPVGAPAAGGSPLDPFSRRRRFLLGRG